ncbi:MAG TPA: sodium:proton antiporter [Candidatus Krumholzibacteria bacterium]|nr:sodium:proton antiporter [Candidatus Krumholzibacteria bacterium]
MDHELGTVLSAWWTIPFAGMLLSIALFPLFARHFWERHYAKVTLFWSLALALPLLALHRAEGTHHLIEVILVDYIPFLVILWALYTVASGIFVTGTMHGTPLQNTLMIAAGTALASWVGTTGASIVMVRPLVRAIAWRKHRAHTVVFFIFLVSNVGGALTPLGDPPLFLGFLHGVPFFWTLRLFPMMLALALPLLVIYFALDSWYYRHDPPKTVYGVRERVGLIGWQNFFFLIVIVMVVLASGTWNAGTVRILGVEREVSGLIRDAALLMISLVSFRTTPEKIHRDNLFSWGPVKEVAVLFAGIFITMIPAIAILRAGDEGALSGMVDLAREPRHYFWLTGGLSSFLDNAPTYLTFFNTALGALEPGKPESEAVKHLLTTHAHYLEAISCGAVFMGANTYIGNAPNFMVKSIAEHAGISMPGFFGYIVKYTIPVLMPLFLIVMFVFFR